MANHNPLIPNVPLPNYKPRPYQLPYWHATEQGIKRRLLIWHRRSGKDETTMHHTCVAAHERVATYWHMLPEYAQARKAIWNAVDPNTGMRRIDQCFPPALRESTNDHEMFIRFKIGSTWQLVGSDNYNALVGSSLGGIVFSEWALANPAAWAFLAPILVESNGWADFISTPRGKNHLASMWADLQNNPDWYLQRLSVNETGFPLEQVQKQLIEYTGIFGQEQAQFLIDQEYFCSFEAAILGSYWGKELIEAERNNQFLEDLTPAFAVPVDTAFDIGVDDATAIWFFQSLASEIRILAYYEASGKGIEHFKEIKDEYQTLHGFDYRGGIDYVPHDAKQRSWTSTSKDGTARQRLEVMRDVGMNPQLVPSATLIDGINAARRTISRCKWNLPNCTLGIEALKEYRRAWDEEQKIFARVPFRNWATHGADAFRYLALAWSGTQRHVDIKPHIKHPTSPIFPGFSLNNRGIMQSNLNFNQMRDRNAKLRKIRIGRR